MAVVEVAYTRRRALSSALVRGFGAGPSGRAWAHVALVRPGRVGVIEALALGGGVVATSWADFVKRNSAIEVVGYEVPDSDAAMRSTLDDLGRLYDWLGAAGAYFRRSWHRADARHCVHVVEGALYAGGLRRWIAPPHAIRPSDSYSNAGGRVGLETIK